ncbi:MAG: hypothetical protein NTW56_11685 [Alphaproteobacteria bacterium]|nr:hypothetical protein [Alphaproteobacteria bacterium]
MSCNSAYASTRAAPVVSSNNITAQRQLQLSGRQAAAADKPLTASLMLRAAEGMMLTHLSDLAARAASGYAALDDLLHEAGQLGVAAYAADTDGYLRRYNDHAEQLWGWSPGIGVQRWFGAWALTHRDGRARPLSTSPMAVALRERRVVTEDVVFGRRPDAGQFANRPLAVPVRSSRWGVVGAVNFLIDVSQRVSIEERHVLN